MRLLQTKIPLLPQRGFSRAPVLNRSSSPLFSPNCARFWSAAPIQRVLGIGAGRDGGSSTPSFRPHYRKASKSSKASPRPDARFGKLRWGKMISKVPLFLCLSSVSLSLPVMFVCVCSLLSLCPECLPHLRTPYFPIHSCTAIHFYCSSKGHTKMNGQNMGFKGAEGPLHFTVGTS